MAKPTLLKRLEYAIPASAEALAEIRPGRVVTERAPVMKVNIDFEKSSLKLEGDWQLIIASNNYHEKTWLSYHKERVKIRTSIYPGTVINLEDPKYDGLVFVLEGNIKDGKITGSCSGLLVVENSRVDNGPLSDHWNIIFYLYDLQFDEWEIKFKLPVYINKSNESNN
jgi:hypothetical protein